MPVYQERKPKIVINEEDLPYEEEILRNPFSIKHWLRYIEFKKDAPRNGVNIIYERALKELPGSYKLWYNYLILRKRQIKGRCISDPSFEHLNNTYERSLVFMNKMPRIWMEYCQFLVDQCKITKARHVFDRSLRALPITQHHRIWPLYTKFLKKHNIPETAVRVFRRYLKLCPEDTEEYIDYLTDIGRLDEAAVRLADIVNTDDFVSKHGKSNHQLWTELCDLISKNPQEVRSLNVDAIIRSGLKKYTDQLGHLWNSLADYYIRSGLFEKARDIYEEAIQTVTTVRDFTQVFDAYAQFEELSLSKKMEEVSQKTFPTDDDDIDIELRLARFEDLIERRLLLLNSVLLRQNPHNVHEWLKRVQLFEGKPHDIIYTYTEAVQTVDPKLAVGKPHMLYVNFAKFYEENGQVEDSRIVLEKGTQVPYTKVEDLASVWCEWAEMEIRNENCDEALKILQRATVMPARKVDYHDDSETVQMRLYKSLKIWSLYADLEESFGTFKGLIALFKENIENKNTDSVSVKEKSEAWGKITNEFNSILGHNQSCKSVYDRIIDLKIATPQIIINYGLFLEEHNYFEEAFRTYEKGIALFKWPNVFDVWNTYLTKFLKRYGGTKLERTRDLFEQCLENCPPKYAKGFYLLYAKLEEEHGLARHAMAVYERATSAVLPEEMFEVFNIYIKKAAEIYGVPKTRQIYEKAIEVLSEDNSREMCLRFAEMETKLGEIDRARAIYAHCSQMCDPRVTSTFWQTWKDFEVRHGNEDTMREMLRIKRSVQATYNTQVNMMSAQMLSAASNVSGTVADLAPGAKDGMRMLEAKAAEMTVSTKSGSSAIMFVRGETQNTSHEVQKEITNPEALDIDSDDEENLEEDDLPVEKQIIPDEVFCGLKKGSDSD